MRADQVSARALCERPWSQYQAFAQRDLGEIDIVYLFVDGVAERLHLGQPREAVLAACGIDSSGVKHLLALPGLKENTSACVDFQRDLTARGMRDPLLVITDGARSRGAGVPAALHQRCLAHKMRNLEAKVPAERWRELGPMARGGLSGHLAGAATRGQGRVPQGMAARAAAACIERLRLPIGHRRAIRTTNILDRMFGKERRRTKVIPAAFGEKAVMRLMYAALMRARQGWRNVIVTSFEVTQIQSRRDRLNDEFEQRHASPLKSASRPRIHRTNGT